MHTSGVDSFESNLPSLSVCNFKHLFTKSTTYLTKIAVTLQDAPDKMLTFSQLIYRLAPLIPEDKKSVEGNIRVCLSSNKCFVKIPMTPGSQDSKRNYWKLDTHQITEKMVRRHFRGVLELFPELASKLKTQVHSSSPPSSSSSSSSPSDKSHIFTPESPVYNKAQVKSREVKFSSPFSIESILKRDSPRSSPLSSVPFRGTKRSLTWNTDDHPSTGLSPVWSVGGSTHHGSPGAAVEGVKRKRHVNSPTWPIYSRESTGHYFNNTNPHIGYISYSVSSLVQEPYRYRL